MTVAPVSERPATGRVESDAARDDRNLAELLQELRVASVGVQVLFGFLLSLPFTTRFAALDGRQRLLYVVSLSLAALASALLIAPVGYHRLVFRQHQKGRLVRTANVMALAGLAAVGLTISAAVLLVVSYVETGPAVAVIGAGVFCVFVCLWFVLPLVLRRKGSSM